MRTLWVAAILLGLFVAVQAQADTVFVKDGRMVWGTEVIEEGNSVVVVRPSGNVTIPKGDVERIERTRVSIPQYYTPPAAAPDKTDASAAPQGTERPPETKSEVPPPPAGIGPTVVPPLAPPSK